MGSAGIWQAAIAFAVAALFGIYLFCVMLLVPSKTELATMIGCKIVEGQGTPGFLCSILLGIINFIGGISGWTAGACFATLAVPGVVLLVVVGAIVYYIVTNVL